MKGFIRRSCWLVLAFTLVAIAAAQETARSGDRAYLGLQLSGGPGCVLPASSPPFVACVIGLRPDGPADRAGVRRGDILRRIGSTTIDSPAALQRATQSLRPGEDVELGYERGAEAMTGTAHLVVDDAVAPPGPASVASTLSSPMPQPPVAPITDWCDSAGMAAAGLAAPPYRKIPLTAGIADIEAQLGQRKAAITQHGEVLTFAFRATADAARLMSGSVQCKLERVEGSADLWALQLRMPEWDRTFLSAQFAAQRNGRWAQTTTEFRGRSAPMAVTRAWANTLAVHTVPSRVLGETRTVTVYLPRKRPAGMLPVLYMTDGIDVMRFAPRVDELIGKGRVRPFAIVGVHAGTMDPDSSGPRIPTLDQRAREYLSFVDPPYFARYLQFFVDELMPWAEQQFGVSSARTDRAVMGYSNGGAFVESLGLSRPEAAATVLPFSPATPPGEAKTPPLGATNAPRFLFAAGELEPQFLRAARDDSDALRKVGVDVTVRTYWSGHDTLLWQQALADYLPEVFPPSR